MEGFKTDSPFDTDSISYFQSRLGELIDGDNVSRTFMSTDERKFGCDRPVSVDGVKTGPEQSIQRGIEASNPSQLSAKMNRNLSSS